MPYVPSVPCLAHSAPAFGCDGCIRTARGETDDAAADPRDAALARAENRATAATQDRAEAYRLAEAHREHAELLRMALRRVLLALPRCGRCDLPATSVESGAAFVCDTHAPVGLIPLGEEYAAALSSASFLLQRKDP